MKKKNSIRNYSKGVSIYSNVYFINSSVKNTMMQQILATGKSPAPKKAQVNPVTKAKIPEICDCVELIIAGKVITDKVMYGT